MTLTGINFHKAKLIPNILQRLLYSLPANINQLVSLLQKLINQDKIRILFVYMNVGDAEVRDFAEFCSLGLLAVLPLSAKSIRPFECFFF